MAKEIYKQTFTYSFRRYQKPLTIKTTTSINVEGWLFLRIKRA
jgi:hypothetical protein